jgi:NAD(P)-dependent dehydrogenase (short-subunit alcohol dehydrogenase family)
MSDSFDPYAEQHASHLQGRRDSRPTALQIIKDNDLVGAWTDKVVLITGATSGIGIETLRAIHATGAKIFITARSMEKADATIKDIRSTSAGKGEIIPIEMDLESLKSVRKGAEEFLSKSSQLNVLINNAGIMACPEAKTIDGYERQFATCHLSHFLLFSLLRDTLLKSSTPEFNSRVVNLSSSGHRASSTHLDNYNLEGIYNEWLAYGQAKTANIHMANHIERLYGSKGLHANSLHPGGIWTPLQKYLPKEATDRWRTPEAEKLMKSPEQGAATTTWAATAKVWEGKGGKFLENCKVSPAADMKSSDALREGYAPWAYDEEAERKLWELSEKLVGVA